MFMYSTLTGTNLRRSEGELPLLSYSKTRQSLPPCHIDEFWVQEWGAEALASTTIPNAGGNSIISEAYSIQYFKDLGATDFIFETQVLYNFFSCKMVDYVMTFQKVRVGVSVARAMNFKVKERFTSEKATQLLQKKLYGLVVARNCVSRKHRFFTSILHIQCETWEMASILEQSYILLREEKSWWDSLRGALTVIFTVISKGSPFCDAVFNRKKKCTSNQIKS